MASGRTEKMSRRATAQAALLAFGLSLLCSLPCRAQSRFVEGDYSHDILRLESLKPVTTWQQAGVRVFVAEEGAVIRQGPVRLAAPRMVVWFDRALSEREGVQAAMVRVYAESAPPRSRLRLIEGQQVREPDAVAILMRFTSTLSFAWDCPLTRSEEPVASPLFTKAQALTRDLQEESWKAVPAAEPEERVEAILELLDAEQMVVFLEEEPIAAVFIGDVHGAYGNLTMRADAAVLWIDMTRDVYEIYAQGNVRISRKPGAPVPAGSRAGAALEIAGLLESLSADEVYINPSRARGLATAAEVRMKDPLAPVDTVYVFRGEEEVYLIDSKTLKVERASITTCGFARPHYLFRAERLQVLREAESALVTAEDVRLYMGEAERTLLWVPFVGVDLTRRSYLLTDYAIGTSSKFGAFVQTTWQPLDLTTPPPWVDTWTVNLDYYGSRGPAVGTELLYEFGQEPYARHEGRVRGYYVSDSGNEDDTGLPVPRQNRGGFHLEHRSQLSRHWRVDAEYYWLSDGGFLDEYFEADFEEEKAPESYLLVRYLRNSTYLALLYKQQVNSFLTQVEQRPSLDLEIVGLPLGRLVYDGSVVAGYYELEFSDALLPPPAGPPSLTRLHTEHKLSLPFSMSIFRLDPFVRALATWAGDSAAVGGSFQGSERRSALGAGLTASTTFSRTFGLASKLFNLNRLRHILIPHAGVEVLTASGAGSEDFIQMDGRDAIDSGTELTLGLRQRLQTKRMQGGRWQSENWAELDVALVSRSSSSVLSALDEDFLRADFEMRLSDHVSLHSRDNRIGLERQPDVLNFGGSLNYLPRWELRLDYDRISDLNSTVTAELICELSDRYKLLVFEQYEFDSRGAGDQRNLQTSIIIRRVLHKWLLDFGLRFEEANQDFAILFGFGPAGWGVFDDRRRARR